jgi:hypothetical protein
MVGILIADNIDVEQDEKISGDLGSWKNLEEPAQRLMTDWSMKGVGVIHC